jgi:RNA recognition motif-containing protein
MNIFVGNLSFEAKEIDVQRVFMAFGVVTSVAIVMEKKGKKSRGFGFVQMPDEQEALAAIAQLQGKEILGRPINVSSAVSKGPKSESNGGGSRHSAAAAPRQGHSFKRTGKYKEGRRSLSYVKQRMDAGITTPVPERRYKSNPLRWLKKPRTQVRFAKPEGELKPWQRPQTESNPWKKPMAKSGSWKKVEGGSKPWVKAENSEARPTKPWKKSVGAARPWRKSSVDRQQSGFKKPGRFSKS